MRSASGPSGSRPRLATSASSATRSCRAPRTWWSIARTSCAPRATARRPRRTRRPSSERSCAQPQASIGSSGSRMRPGQYALDMKLEGIHHVTAITADAQANVDFYVGVLGLRLVKKSINQDDTSVYHLFYADESGDPGSDITFFEYPGVPRGRPGAGMIHRVVWRVASTLALDFWHVRLTAPGCDPVRTDVA